MIRVALTPRGTNRIVPQVGMIAPFYLAPDALPTGWWACDGNHSTPDLRGKFLIGAGSRTIPMNQAQSHTADRGRTVYGLGFEPAEPLRMEVPLGDWVIEAGERNPDPPTMACRSPADKDLAILKCLLDTDEATVGVPNTAENTSVGVCGYSKARGSTHPAALDMCSYRLVNCPASFVLDGSLYYV